jgi:cytochrome c peroxidase
MDKRDLSASKLGSSKTALFSLVALAALAQPLACGDGDAKTGAGGRGGSAGKAGSGGGSGKGGNGGTAGTSTGGTAGKGDGGKGGGGAGGSMSGGKGGTAGDEGAGRGGAGRGGDAGSGGSMGGEGGETSPEAGAGGEGGSAPDHDVFFTDEEWALIVELGPLGAVPADSTNAYADNAAAAALGQKFFFEKDFAGALADLGTGVVNDLGNAGETGKVACVSCHFTATMSDHRSNPSNVSLGANFHTRNAPAMVNSSFYPWTNWGGRFSRQWELPMPVTESGVIMNSSRLRVAHVIFDQYKAEYEAVFGAAFGPMEPAIGTDLGRFPATGKPKANMVDPDGPWELMTAGDRTIVTRIFVNYAKALAAYTRKLVSRNAPFDVYVAGDWDNLSVSAKRGLRLFIGSAGCSGCHGGPHFSDGGFHNIGVPQTGAHVPGSDDGRFKDIPPLQASGLNAGSTWSDDPTAGGAIITALNPADEANRAAFRTPSLRGVADSAPYMHSGQLATLADVIDFYAAGGGTPSAGTKEITPITLSTTDKQDLVAFMMTLTGEAVAPGLRTDTSQ